MKKDLRKNQFFYYWVLHVKKKMSRMIKKMKSRMTKGDTTFRIVSLLQTAKETLKLDRTNDNTYF